MHNSKVIRTRWSYRCSQPKLFYDNHVSVKNFFLVSSLNLPNISSDHFLSSYHLSSEKRNKHLLCCNLLSSSCRKWWGPLGPPPVRFWIITKMETLQLLSRSHCSTSLTLKCLLILKFLYFLLIPLLRILLLRTTEKLLAPGWVVPAFSASHHISDAPILSVFLIALLWITLLCPFSFLLASPPMNPVLCFNII